MRCIAEHISSPYNQDFYENKRVTGNENQDYGAML